MIDIGSVFIAYNESGESWDASYTSPSGRKPIVLAIFDAPQRDDVPSTNVASIRKEFSDLIETEFLRAVHDHGIDPQLAIEDVLSKLNARLLKLQVEHHTRFVATVALAMVHRGVASLAAVGDAVAAVVHKSHVIRVTEGNLPNGGYIVGTEKADPSLEINREPRFIGTEGFDATTVLYREHRLAPHDLILVYSDGLEKSVPPHELAIQLKDIVQEPGAAKQSAAKIRSLVQNAVIKDDISLLSLAPNQTFSTVEDIVKGQIEELSSFVKNHADVLVSQIQRSIEGERQTVVRAFEEVIKRQVQSIAESREDWNSKIKSLIDEHSRGIERAYAEVVEQSIRTYRNAISGIDTEIKSQIYQYRRELEDTSRRIISEMHRIDRTDGKSLLKTLKEIRAVVKDISRNQPNLDFLVDISRHLASVTEQAERLRDASDQLELSRLATLAELHPKRSGNTESTAVSWRSIRKLLGDYWWVYLCIAFLVVIVIVITVLTRTGQ